MKVKLKVKKLNFSITGKSHREQNSICQDYTYARVSDDTAVIAVADGAGSSRRSHIGSKIVANCFAHYARKRFDFFFEDPREFRLLLEYISDKIRRRAERERLPYREFYSTLIGVAVRGDRFVAVHVGDGMLAAYSDDGEIKLLSKGQKGEFANETQFLTEELTPEKIFTLTGTLEQFEGFILATDGSESFLYNKRNNSFSNLLYKLERWIASYSPLYLKRKIKSELQKVAFQLTDDDISLAVCKIDR